MSQNLKDTGKFLVILGSAMLAFGVVCILLPVVVAIIIVVLAAMGC